MRLRLLHALLFAALGAACSTPRADPVTVLNWNTYLMFSGREHLAEATEWIRALGPDIAAFQEVPTGSEAAWHELAAGWGHEHAASLKDHGYPVALSSRFPIEVVERRVEGFHHGYLHARSAGFDLLLVHFWPTRTHEAEVVAELAAELVEQGRAVIVLGDFNSPIRLDEPHFAALGYEGETIEGEKRIDYRMTDAFLDRGFVDLIHAHAPEASYSFSSPALIPRWRDSLEEVYATRRRIDFVFADEQTAKRVLDAAIITDDATVGQWSDHYPMWVRLPRP